MADEQEQFGVKFTATTQAVTEAKESFQHLTEEMKGTSQAGEIVATTTKTVDDAVKELRQQIADLEVVIRKQAEALAAGELPLDVFLRGNQAARTVIGQLEGSIESLIGSDEGGGFKGIASNVIKAEKIISGLVSGSGFGRMGPMLESITGALGLAGGAGMAAGGLIFAFEAVIPKIEKFIEKMDGAAAAAARTAEQVKLAQDQMAKFIGQPTEEEETGAKAVKGLLGGRGGALVAQGIEQALRQQGVGLMAPGERALSETFVGPLATAEAEREQQDQAVAIQRAAIMRDLMAGRTPAISQVSGMAGQFPGLFPAGTEQRFRQALPENIEAAKKQARDAEEVSRQADEEYARQIEAQKEAQKKIAERRKRVEHAQRIEDEGIIQQADEADRAERDAARQAEKQQRDADRAQAQAQREAVREASRAGRENTPEKQKQRAIGEEIERQGGATADPDFVRQVAAQASRNVTMGADIANAVQWAVQQTEAKIMAEFMRGMGQQNRTGQNITPFGGL